MAVWRIYPVITWIRGWDSNGLCMAVQGKTSNYDTDVFTPIIGEICPA